MAMMMAADDKVNKVDGDSAAGDGATGNGATGDGATGDGATGDGAMGDGATTMTMAMGNDDDDDGDGVTGNEVNNDGDGATCVEGDCRLVECRYKLPRCLSPFQLRRKSMGGIPPSPFAKMWARPG